MLASLDVAALRGLEPAQSGREPPPDDLPESGGLRPMSDSRLPWGGSVLDWDNRNGERAIRLIKVGLQQHAATIVKRLSEVPGQDPETVAYARARILYALGDFNGAFRIGATIFRDEIRGEPSGEVRRYFRIAYPDAHVEAVRRAAEEFGVSPLVLWSVMRQESAFQTKARSWAAAQGLMQIIPPTGERIARALGDNDFAAGQLNSPAVNVRYGAWYLGQLLEKFHGSLPLALGSYNAGPKAVSRWVDVAGGLPTDEFIEEIPYRETRHYVKRVLGNLAVYSALYGGRPMTVRETVPTEYQDNVDF
jgi:soluble lytic murein transglycosylase